MAAAVTSVITAQHNHIRATAGIMLAGAAAFSMEYCIQPVITKIAATFGLNPAQASLSISAAIFGMALTLLALTACADKLPRRKMLALSLIASSAVMCGVAFIHSFAAVAALRFVQGCILALVPVLAMSYVNEEFSPEKTAAGIGMYVSGTTLGGITGRITVSTLTDFFNWQYATAILCAAAAIAGLLVFWLLPPERHAPQKSSAGFDTAVFSRKNKKLFYLCAAAFCMMGSFVAVYNFISYVLKDAPYNLSQSVIGFLYGVQIFGTFSSAMAGRLSAQYGSAKIIAASLAVLAGGALLTLNGILLVKIAGVAMVSFGLAGAHSAASGWSGKLVTTAKAAAGSLYMFAYYSGASILGSLGGVFYGGFGWGGVVAMASLSALAALMLIRLAAK